MVTGCYKTCPCFRDFDTTSFCSMLFHWNYDYHYVRCQDRQGNQQQAGKGSSAFGRQYKRVWYKKHLKKGITLVTLLNALESWLTYRDRLRLYERFHQRCLRNIHWSNFVTNLIYLKRRRSPASRQCYWILSSVGQNSSPAQHHTVEQALRWLSQQRGTKEAIQGLLEKMLWCLLNRSSSEPRHQMFHHQLSCFFCWKHTQGRSQGQKVQDEESLCYQTLIRNSVAVAAIVFTCPTSFLSVTNMPAVGVDQSYFDLRFTIYLSIYLMAICCARVCLVECVYKTLQWTLTIWEWRRKRSR